jgi:cardiolipin synthase
VWDIEGAERGGGRVLSLPNSLTVSRVLCTPAVVVLLLTRADSLAAAVFVTAAATDFLDGWLARRAGPTRLGQVLDPVADRLMLSSVAVVLAVRGLLPVWAVAILVGRDALALIGSLTVGSRVGVNRAGKAATFLLMVAVVLIIFDVRTAGEIVFYAGFGFSLLSGVLYLGRVSELLGLEDSR